MNRFAVNKRKYVDHTAVLKYLLNHETSAKAQSRTTVRKWRSYGSQMSPGPSEYQYVYDFEFSFVTVS